MADITSEEVMDGHIERRIDGLVHLTHFHGAVYITVVAVIVVVLSKRFLALTTHGQRVSKSARETKELKRMATTNIIYALGAILYWPLWFMVCGKSVETMPSIAAVGLAWPQVLILLDMLFLHHSFDKHDTNNGGSTAKRAQTIAMDSNILSGLALTIGGLFVRYISDGYATAASPMFVASLFVLLLVVIPSPDVEPSSVHAAALLAVQKVGIQYCLGFVLTSVALTLGVGLKKSSHQGEELAKVMAEP